MCIRDRFSSVLPGVQDSVLTINIYSRDASLFISDIMLNEGTTPVSYTHLDVYKRQAVSLLSDLTTLVETWDIPVETGVFSDTAPDKYLVLVPLSDTFAVHALSLIHIFLCSGKPS